jgi:hypothetical protein
LTYDSETLKKYNQKCDEYITEITDEFLKLHKRFCDSLGVFPLTIHLFLVPLNTKDDLIKKLEEKLKIWQQI